MDRHEIAINLARASLNRCATVREQIIREYKPTSTVRDETLGELLAILKEDTKMLRSEAGKLAWERDSEWTRKRQRAVREMSAEVTKERQRLWKLRDYGRNVAKVSF